MLEILDLREQDDQGLIAESSAVLLEEIKNYKSLIDNMIKVSEESKALGLAAPQLGINKRIIVFKNITGSYDTIINPEIIAWGGRVVSRAEGCLSLLGERYDVRRRKDIVVIGLDREGKPIRIKTRNKSIAFALQHEIDHLNGILIRHVEVKIDY